MPSVNNAVEEQVDPYSESLLTEGAYWDNFIANRLLEHDEIPGSVDFRIFFSQFSYKHNWGPPCLGPIAINFREKEIRYILAQVARVRGARVLDLGCGSGWLSLELARQGANVTAVDISPTNLALGRYMVENNARHFPFLYQRFAGFPCRLEEFGSVEYLYGDLNTITLPAHEYDAVVVWDSLHHVRDLERLLEQVRAALKPDGIFVGVDHAFATPLTIEFHNAFVPWLLDINSWLELKHPTGLYRNINEIARQYDWGVLGVDYDVAPIPGFAEFEAEVRNDMLGIISTNSPQVKSSQPNGKETHEEVSESETPSPFEDVSASRLMRVLIDRFKAEHFRTICPLIMPERHFHTPRDEEERIFQHYLSAFVTEISEHAIERGQADGQWFVFHMTPQEPVPADISRELSRIRNSRSVEEVEEGPTVEMLEGTPITEITGGSEQLLSGEQLLFELNNVRNVLENTRAYGTFLEAEVARKNDALSGLERRVKQLESEAIRSRKPRLPWKKSDLTEF